VLVLFDYRATHSFISDASVAKLSLERCDLDCELLVSTSSSGQVATSSVCVGCVIEVAGRKFKVNLVYLPLEGLDVILGMDLLSDNHIIIDYGWRSLVFPKHAGLELISLCLLSVRNWSKVSLLLTSISRKMLARVICPLSWAIGVTMGGE